MREFLLKQKLLILQIYQKIGNIGKQKVRFTEVRSYQGENNALSSRLCVVDTISSSRTIPSGHPGVWECNHDRCCSYYSWGIEAINRCLPLIKSMLIYVDVSNEPILLLFSRTDLTDACEIYPRVAYRHLL